MSRRCSTCGRVKGLGYTQCSRSLPFMPASVEAECYRRGNVRLRRENAALRREVERLKTEEVPRG